MTRWLPGWVDVDEDDRPVDWFQRRWINYFLILVGIIVATLLIVRSIG